MKKDLGARLKKLRGKSSQTEIAALLGVKQQTYATWENGKYEPNITSLACICRHYSVSSDWLLGLSNVSKPDQSPPERNPRTSHMATEALVDAKIAEAASGPCRSCAAKDAIIADLSATLRDLAKSASGVGFPTPRSPSAKTLAPY